MLQAPVATSVSGKGVIPDSHPLAVGWGYGAYGTRAAERAFKDVDLVLAVGVRYSEVSTANYAVPTDPLLIHVDANPANLGRNLPTCVKVHADAPLFLARLLSENAALRRPACPAIPAAIQAGRQHDRKANHRVKVKSGVDPMFFYAQMRHVLPPDDLIFVDVTASVHWASEVIDVEGPRRYFTPTNNQSMGWAIPASIGAQRVRLDRRVVCVAGDGCFLMGRPGMSRRRRGPACRSSSSCSMTERITTCRCFRSLSFGRTTATEIARLNFCAFAQGLGLGYNEIGSNEDAVAGILRALNTPGPVLTRVVIGYEGREIRWLNALKKSYLDHLNTGQVVRLASRVAVRAAIPGQNSD